MTEPFALARKWTRLEYNRLVEAEFLGPEDRIELLGGHMIVKEPQYSPHATSICLAQGALMAARSRYRAGDSTASPRVASMPERGSSTTGS
jgi:hypothetical protein